MKIKLLLPVSLLLTCISVNAPALAQSKPPATQPTTTQDTEKINNIKKLMTITGSQNVSEQVINQLFKNLNTQFPQVPQKFWDTFKAELNLNELNQRIMPIYAKYLSNEDIKGLIAFYQTPLGKKLITILPQISVESAQIGQQYGLEVAKRALAKLEAEGYIRPRDRR